MKKLSWFNRIVYFFNIILTLLTVTGYVLPFLAPRMFPILAVLTLGLPFLLMLNLLFFFYWLLQVRKQLLLSGLVLLVGIGFVNKWYRFSSENLPLSQDDFTVLSYNVRLFNKYKWIDNDSVLPDIKKFIEAENPDILCIQEYADAGQKFKQYPYKHIYFKNKRKNFGQAILSKFPIVGKGEIIFENSSNNVIFADIKKGNDTLRIYSMHLQSIQITKDIAQIDSELNQEKSELIVRKIAKAFATQQEQATILQEHKNECNYPVIICGDMNNSAFSYVYRSVKGNLNDAFEKAGSGFGKSYNFKYYPARIDYIFSDKSLEVKEFKNYTLQKGSDHFPIKARFSF
ncbi:MAG: endonuclease/exonuclease/phosphatase family protein [Flavobacteriaceae bacterium]